MILRPRDKRKIDIDNRIKAVLDSLQDAGVFDDDFQVDHIEMIRGEQIKGGLIRVLIEELPENHQDPRYLEGESLWGQLGTVRGTDSSSPTNLKG